MDRQAAINQIRQSCIAVAQELFRIHPAVPALQDKTLQDEIYRSLFELTKQVEAIKKQLARLEARDASRDL